MNDDTSGILWPSLFAAVLAAFTAFFVWSGEPNSEPPAPDESAPAAAAHAAQAADGSDEPSQPPPSLPERPKQTDNGIFAEFDSKVSLKLPAWIDEDELRVVDGPGEGSLVAYVDQTPVGLAHRRMGEPVAIAEWGQNDADADGIPNGLDILIGAKKTALNKAKYQGGYKGMSYPGGDVPRTEGVCTDVIVRAVRNAGIDLQKELHEDIEDHPARYPMVDNPDPNIDQRRVRTLLPYFEHNWQPLGDGALWAPGDVLFMNTMGDERPDHVGIVSDRVGDSGRPLVINNWTNGYHTQPMDLLGFVPVTHRFRVPSEPLQVVSALDAALQRHTIALPDKHRQALLVETDPAANSKGRLLRFDRNKSGEWTQVGQTISVRLGAAGLGAGRGLYDADFSGMPSKKEGDQRSPAGVFALGTAFGTIDKPYEGGWPWRSVDEHDRWIDDPNSPQYNTWQRAIKNGEAAGWRSAEKLAMYRLGLVVQHNTDPVKPGAGSAIFLHTFAVGDGATLGCTAMRQAALVELLGWLEPNAHAVLVQVPGASAK